MVSDSLWAPDKWDGRPNLQQVILNEEFRRSRDVKDVILGGQMPIKEITREGKNITHDIVKWIVGKGYKLLWASTQHAAGWTWDDVVDLAGYAREEGAHITFRVPATSQVDTITEFLDKGGTGITVPQVEKPETVEAALDQMWYPSQGDKIFDPAFPTGNRSFGPRKAAGQPSVQGKEYHNWWNSFGILGLQLESHVAVANIPILARHGVGVQVFDTGPNDFKTQVRRAYTIAVRQGLNFQITPAMEEVVKADSMDLYIQEIVAHVTALEMTKGLISVAAHRDYDRFTPDKVKLVNAKPMREDLRAKYAAMGVKLLWENPLVDRNLR